MCFPGWLAGTVGFVSFSNYQMPPDPFADDPNDPASLLGPVEGDEVMEPIDATEEAALREDLANVRVFRELLEPHGVRGVAMLCEDCDEQHYYDWGIIESNIVSMLNHQHLPVHEPSAAPSPQDYVTWDYCLGYADAMDFANEQLRARFPWTGRL